MQSRAAARMDPPCESLQPRGRERDQRSSVRVLSGRAEASFSGAGPVLALGSDTRVHYFKIPVHYFFFLNPPFTSPLRKPLRCLYC